MISLMLTAPFLLTKYVWPSMKEQRWGRIDNLNSIHGLVASEYKAAYVKTPLVENQIEAQALNDGITEEEVVSKIMLHKASVKTLLEPSVIAEAVKFLCSEAGNNITGSALTIDGGWTAA